jgi:hypothetical protein
MNLPLKHQNELAVHFPVNFILNKWFVPSNRYTKALVPKNHSLINHFEWFFRWSKTLSFGIPKREYKMRPVACSLPPMYKSTLSQYAKAFC